MLKDFFKRLKLVYRPYLFFRGKWKNYCYLKRTQFHLGGKYKFKKDIIGYDNKIIIGKNCHIKKSILLIRGNNNELTIGDNCSIGKDCSFWFIGNNSKIIIGNNTSFTLGVHLNVGEDNRKIMVGNNCMIANTIVIRTSDDHTIYDLETSQRLNPANDVIIADHVWIAPNTKIMKGAEIPFGCIIGSDSTISKKFEEPNCLIVGRPGKIIRHNIGWNHKIIN